MATDKSAKPIFDATTSDTASAGAQPANAASADPAPAHGYPAFVRDQVRVRGEIPRLAWTDPAAWILLSKEQPVILTGTGLADCIVGKWSPEYLREHLLGSVHVFSNNSHKCKYYDKKKHHGPYKWNEKEAAVSWNTPMDEFYRLFVQDPGTKVVADEADPKPQNMRWHYMQEALTVQNGPAIIDDARGFKWELVEAFKLKLNLGNLRTNMILVGPKGINTPCHYDEQANFFYQVQGRKEMLLWSPADYGYMYPYPVDHSHDRQSQVDLDSVDRQRFPNFDKGPGALRGVVGPADVLYIPAYWWHDVTSLDQTVSLTFWMMAQPEGPKPPEITLTLSSHAAVRRNMEKMISQQVGPALVKNILALTTDPALVREAVTEGTRPPPEGKDVNPQEVHRQLAKNAVALSGILFPGEAALLDMFRGMYDGRFDC